MIAGKAYTMQLHQAMIELKEYGVTPGAVAIPKIALAVLWSAIETAEDSGNEQPGLRRFVDRLEKLERERRLVKLGPPVFGL